MKFTNTDVSNLTNIINTCFLGNIDMLTLSTDENGNGFLRAINNDSTCILFAKENIPELNPNSKLALKKLKILKQRLDLFKGDDQLSIEAKTKANGDINELAIKGRNATVQYKTASIASVTCPVEVEDTPVKKIFLTKEEIALLLNAEKAMGSNKITFKIDKKNNVVVEYMDNVKDVFSISLSLPAEDLGTSINTVTSIFFTDVFSPIVKAAANIYDTVAIEIFEASAKISIDNYTLILLSPMDNE